MNDSKLIIEEVHDPAEAARFRAQHEQAKRNDDWLQAHWADVLPQARGKFLAVAGQEAHIAETPEEAWAWAEAAHPEDHGAIVTMAKWRASGATLLPSPIPPPPT